ncbi:MAG: metallophosphoesterase [Clostridia bacterium]|nr:metallophosphoesterase [Clostridia bacterium]
MKKFLKVLFFIFIGIIALCGLFTVANVVNGVVMNGYIDSFSSVEKENALTVQYGENGEAYFVTDGDFKVMHLTDVHIGGGVLSAWNDRMAINAVAAMVTEEKPDLVVVTGDISFAIPTTATLNNGYAHRFFARLMERLGVYWTVTFGNHDSENYNYHTRREVAELYSREELEHCLFSSGPDGVFGECNHAISVRGSSGIVRELFVMIDTNAYSEDDPLGLGWDYDRIRDDQIEWYRGVVEYYQEYNESLLSELSLDLSDEVISRYSAVKSMVFMHIPIREVKAAYDEYVGNNRQNTENTEYLGGVDGESDQVVYCPEEDENMFETILELGSTEAMFYGHDHLNNFVLKYKGVTLSYGLSIDYLAYFGIAGQGDQRGCTVITVSDSSPIIVHENYYQDKYAPLYEKESVTLSER